MNLKRIDYAIPVIITILYFLAIKNVVPPVIYMIVTILAGFYYIPYRLVMQLKGSAGMTALRKVEIITMNIDFYFILFLSILRLTLGASRSLSNAVGILGIITYIGMFYYFSTEKKGDSGMIFFIFSWLISSVEFVD